MKTYAPRSLRGRDLETLLSELQATPGQVAKILQVSERSVFRWLADGSAPYAVLAALWHETPTGRHVTALDVGNELAITHALAHAQAARVDAGAAQLRRLLAISDTGAANDPIQGVPTPPRPAAGPRRSIPAASVRRAIAHRYRWR